MGGMETGMTLARLKSLVGAELRYQGMRCLLVDVLDQPPIVVLRPIDADPVVQTDNFGKPMRHAPPLFELPVFGPDGVSLSAEARLISVPEDRSTAAG
ncbi:MAG: hypothetical protein ACNA8G_06505 [Gammaproteobacteria bacterium]